ncbi:hypothetical protein EV286_102524 [Rhizobium sp. BK251]|nr:hypothetical protein EV286_102524 [Rhizobium sp. BK251]
MGDSRIISELTIGLSADALSAKADGPRLATLMQGAGSTRFGCNEGIVDAAGF